MSLRPYYALSHVASQILGRYLSVNVPVEHCSQHALFSSGENGIEQWKRPDWEEFLRAERGRPSGLLPWLNLYMDRYDHQGALLLTKLWFHLKWCREEGANDLLLCDPGYPEVLREIPQAPLALSLLGDLAVFAMPRVSVVGSRRTAQVVLQESYRVGFMLGQLGVVVVSGGAYGCDIATHQGVLVWNDFSHKGIVRHSTRSGIKVASLSRNVCGIKFRNHMTFPFATALLVASPCGRSLWEQRNSRGLW